MADEQLRGLTLDNVFIDELQVPIPEQWRTELLGEWIPQTPARRWWTLGTPSEPEYGQSIMTTEILQQARYLMEGRRLPSRGLRVPPININAGHVNHITATEVRERQESRRTMINNMFATYGKIFPTPEKEKKQIKRGNPWAQ